MSTKKTKSPEDNKVVNLVKADANKNNASKPAEPAKMDLEAAAKALQADAEDRAKKAKEALDKLCADYKVELIPMAIFGEGAKVPVNQVLAVPVGIIISAK
jgi:hypothetical protein